MRLIRSALDRITLPDAVTGVTLRVESVIGNDGVQGDLFDKGFASAPQVERTVSQLMDDQGDVVLTPENSAHPLVDARTTWTREDPAVAAASGERGAAKAQRGGGATPTPRLTLQLVTPPRPVSVRTAERRDHQVPVRYRDAGKSYAIVDAAGPERVSGGQWEEGGPYAREYFRCVREDGTLVWLYRDAARERASGTSMAGGIEPSCRTSSFARTPRSPSVMDRRPRKRSSPARTRSATAASPSPTPPTSAPSSARSSRRAPAIRRWNSSSAPRSTSTASPPLFWRAMRRGIATWLRSSPRRASATGPPGTRAPSTNGAAAPASPGSRLPVTPTACTRSRDRGRDRWRRLCERETRKGHAGYCASGRRSSVGSWQ